MAVASADTAIQAHQRGLSPPLVSMLYLLLRATIKPNTSPTTRNHPQLQSRPLQNLALKSAIVLHCFRALCATLAIMKTKDGQHGSQHSFRLPIQRPHYRHTNHHSLPAPPDTSLALLLPRGSYRMGAVLPIKGGGDVQCHHQLWRSMQAQVWCVERGRGRREEGPLVSVDEESRCTMGVKIPQVTISLLDYALKTKSRPLRHLLGGEVVAVVVVAIAVEAEEEAAKCKR
mmetsp:Transcript_68873/g.100876  ORF Transcript_68873/g.100876 Transcript_68873/m.100876 type:complete len:230 (+) Transcript_68873:1442-2131(+)